MTPKRKLPKTFISFLIISFFIWLLIAFSKEYTTTLKFSVSYSNIAQNKLLQKEPIKEIDITLKASGFKILRSQIYNNDIALEASNLRRKNKNLFYFLPKNQSSKIEKQLLSGVQIIEILQDTIFLNIGVLATKKVALKPNLEINYHIGYGLLEEIKITPDSISVSGTESQLDEIDYLDLNQLTLNDVKSNFEEKLTIQTPKDSKNLKFSANSVTVTGKVEKFTEGKLEIPFSIHNLPKGTNITTLAENIELSFVVALPDYAKVSEASFKIECDYKISADNNLGYLIPKVTRKPSFLKSFKITPNKIDFLIQK